MIRIRSGCRAGPMNSPQRPHRVRLRGLIRLLPIVVVAALMLATSAAAQVSPEAAQKTADAAIGRLRSPFCPGLMLEVCPSPNAEALRDTIRGMAAQGQSAEQIVEGVLARHGEEWRAVPKRSGVGLLAWLVLPAALVLGGLFVWTRIRAMRGQGQVYAVAAGQGVTDDERSRLDAALRDLDRAEDDA
ncbi:MAG TPA: cytochrome c-type biogenesis protein CcmH [Longimicrobium sp.]